MSNDPRSLLNGLTFVQPIEDPRDALIQRLREERDRAMADRDALAGERDRAAADRDALALERDRAAADRDTFAGERERLAAEAARLASEVARLAAENQRLQQKVDELSRRLFGRSTEKVDRADLARAAEEPPGPDTPPPPPFVDEAMDVEPRPKESRKERKRAAHGRRPLPATLPRERVLHDLAPEDRRCPCCGGERRPFGEEVTETLDYVPASLRVIEHVRIKYSCPACQGEVACAPLPPLPIEKGRPGSGLLAHVVTAKYGDHLPLHRLEEIFRREGVEIGRSTLCDWVEETAFLLRSVAQEIRRSIRKRPVIGGDDTEIRVLDKGVSGGSRKGRMWAYRGDPGEVAFDHTATKSGDGPAEFLAGYRGYFQADAANSYDRLFEDGTIMEVGCWAHARRKFYNARETSPTEASWTLAAIRRMYEVEAEATERNATSEERLALRVEKARPIVESLFEWLEALKPSLRGGTFLATAVGYALNQKAALSRYLEDGRLAIDNNAVERALRQVAVGRRAWLFAGSTRGAEAGAILYSLVVSAKEIGLDPYAYLRDVIERVSTHPMSAISELTPRGWKAARERPSTA